MDILIEDTHSLSMSGPPKDDDDATYEPDNEGEDQDTEDAAPQVTLGYFLASQNKTLGKYPTHREEHTAFLSGFQNCQGM